MKIINILSQVKYALKILGVSFGFMGFYLVLAFNGYDMEIILHLWGIYIFFEVVVALHNSLNKKERKR